MVTLSTILTRDVSYSTIKKYVSIILDTVLKNSREDIIKDLIVLAFYTRDIHGGKGERLASENLFKSLLENHYSRKLTLEVLEFIPNYGSWRDLFSLGTYYCGNRLVDIVEKQFLKDENALAIGERVSLLAKWMPREGQTDVFPFVARLVPGKMFYFTRMKIYRKRLSRLNRAIDTVEIKMCANNWDMIDPNKVPAKAMKKYTRAFLNLNGTTTNNKIPLDGLRHPGSAIRTLCRENFQQHFRDTFTEKVRRNSNTIFPHELIKKAVELIGGPAFNPNTIPYDEIYYIEGVWKAMVNVARMGGGLSRSLAMCDFSKSMENSRMNGSTPYWASIALGLLISEITTGEFKDTIMSFDSRPTFHHFPQGGVFNKLKTLGTRDRQGQATDFQEAMDLVLTVLKNARAKPGDEPENLIVLTDKYWDKTSLSNKFDSDIANEYRNTLRLPSWETRIEKIRNDFKRAGEDMWGVGNGLTVPRIVIWNLATVSDAFYATPEVDGVVMLSGWSPNLFKVLQKDGIVVKTLFEALRNQIDNESYDSLRFHIEKIIRSTAYD